MEIVKGFEEIDRLHCLPFIKHKWMNASPMDGEEKTEGLSLEAKLGLLDAIAINVGAIIGAGIFVVIGIAAGVAGSALPVSMLLASVIAFFTAISFIELSSWRPMEGSIYEYAYQLVSPFCGFLTGWMWIVSNIFAGAAVSIGLAEHLHNLLPALPTKVLATIICMFFSALNLLGVKQSSFVNNILVTAKLLILGFFTFYGALYIDPSNFADFNVFQPGVLYGAFIIFFAYGGFARAVVIAEEVKDARRNVPKAVLISLVVSTIFYLLVGSVAIGLIGANKLAKSDSPLVEAIENTGSPSAVYLILFGGIIAMASVLLTTILGVSRMVYSMARRNDLPQKLMKLHSKYRTPYNAILAVCAVMIFLNLFVDLKNIVTVSIFSMLFYYAMANISALKLKRPDRVYPAALPILGIISCLILMVFTIFFAIEAWVTGLLVLALGIITYWIKENYLHSLNSQGKDV
ncbi:MAG: APC family permease [Candidatus Bathyarchaeia archaeon]